MKTVPIITFIEFLKNNNALENFFGAVKEEEEFLDYVLKQAPDFLWLNAFIWEETKEGYRYWHALEQAWHKEIGFDPEADLE